MAPGAGRPATPRWTPKAVVRAGAGVSPRRRAHVLGGQRVRRGTCAAALGAARNPPAAVDAARSKVRTRETSAGAGPAHADAPCACGRSTSCSPRPARSGFPAVVKPEFGAKAMGCVRVDDFGVAAEHLLTRPRRRAARARRHLPRRQRPAARGVSRRRRVRRRPRDARGPVRVLQRLTELAHGRTVVPGDRPSPSGRPRPKRVRQLVDLVGADRHGLRLQRGVLHVEGKCTTRGPRIIEVNARMGGGRIHEMVRDVWGVDLVEAHLRSCLDLPPSLNPRISVRTSTARRAWSSAMRARRSGWSNPASATSAFRPAIAFPTATRTSSRRRCTSSCAGAGG